MEDELYRYMMEHFKEEELLKKKMVFFKDRIQIQKNSGDRFQVEYHMPRCQEYLLTLMGELHYPIKEIRSYAKTIKSYFVKETLVKIELDYGNLDEAISAYEELADREDQRYGRNEYREKLMRIYQENGMQEKYFESLKKALLAAKGDVELWKEYKGIFSSDEWPNACEEIFSSAKIGDIRMNTWYEEEGRYDLIMACVEAVNDTTQLKEYEKKLKKLYPERCLSVLVSNAEQMAQDGNKRSDYRRLAGLLNWIQKYPGGDDVSEQLAEKYREAYPRRKAMLEEIAGF